jgi:hypothetical protein
VADFLGPILHEKESNMRNAILLAVLFGALNGSLRAQDQDARIEELAKKLKEARQVAVTLQKTIDLLTDELESLQKSGKATSPQAIASTSHTTAKSGKSDFKDQILVPDLGGDERSNRLTARPELFVQSRYSAVPLQGTDVSTAPSNFELTRMESRWSGAVSDKIGMGFEIQYHPAPDGTPEQIVNDAFVTLLIRSLCVQASSSYHSVSTFSNPAASVNPPSAEYSRATFSPANAITAS